MTSEEAVKLYLVINKLIYKHTELGTTIYNKSRNPDVDNPIYQTFIDVSLAITSLLDNDDNIIYKGASYPIYGILEGQELQQYLDYLIFKFNLDPVPYIDFPKNTTNIISSGDTVNISSENGTLLPTGGGTGFYLTKDNSGNLIWESLDTIKSDFNQI